VLVTGVVAAADERGLDMLMVEGVFVGRGRCDVAALQRGRYVPRGLRGSIAGLTRPNGLGSCSRSSSLSGSRRAAAGASLRASSPRRHRRRSASVVSLAHVPCDRPGSTAGCAGAQTVEQRIRRWGRRSSFASTTCSPRQRPRTVAGAQARRSSSHSHRPTSPWLRRTWARTPAEIAYVTVAGVLAIGERHYDHVKPRFLLVAVPGARPARALAGRRSTRASWHWCRFLWRRWPGMPISSRSGRARSEGRRRCPAPGPAQRSSPSHGGSPARTAVTLERGRPLLQANRRFRRCRPTARHRSRWCRQRARCQRSRARRRARPQREQADPHRPEQTEGGSRYDRRDADPSEGSDRVGIGPRRSRTARRHRRPRPADRDPCRPFAPAPTTAPTGTLGRTGS